jgi:hypothetical protein
MKPASRYFRWILVASLSLSLIGGGFCSPTVMASCSAGNSTHHATKRCCCGENCKCGVACPSRNVPDKSQQPTKSSEQDLRDLVKITPALCCAVCELTFGQRLSKPASDFCPDSHSPQTLIAQHTCLQV